MKQPFLFPSLTPPFLPAHTEAVDNARILHRDISIGNVIISDRGGLLIDWDLSKDVDDLANISRQPYRTVSLIFKWLHHAHAMISL